MDMLNTGNWNSDWSMEGVNAFKKIAHSSICIEKRDFNSKLTCTLQVVTRCINNHKFEYAESFNFILEDCSVRKKHLVYILVIC